MAKPILVVKVPSMFVDELKLEQIRHKTENRIGSEYHVLAMTHTDKAKRDVEFQCINPSDAIDVADLEDLRKELLRL